jgi:hypothetical protein
MPATTAAVIVSLNHGGISNPGTFRFIDLGILIVTERPCGTGTPGIRGCSGLKGSPG